MICSDFPVLFSRQMYELFYFTLSYLVYVPFKILLLSNVHHICPLKHLKRHHNLFLVTASLDYLVFLYFYVFDSNMICKLFWKKLKAGHLAASANKE